MRLPSLWAGMGRAMNNVSAALITNGSVALLATGNSLAAIVIALVLFVAVSVAMAVYTARMNAVMEPKEPPASQKSDEERREAFIAKIRADRTGMGCIFPDDFFGQQRPGDRRLPVPVQADGGTAYLQPCTKRRAQNPASLCTCFTVTINIQDKRTPAFSQERQGVFVCGNELS